MIAIQGPLQVFGCDGSLKAGSVAAVSGMSSLVRPGEEKGLRQRLICRYIARDFSHARSGLICAAVCSTFSSVYSALSRCGAVFNTNASAMP